jgi:hypothetical protein
MNGRILGALLVAAVVGFTLLSCGPFQSPANGQPGGKAQQWEYKIVDNMLVTGSGILQADAEKELNKLGAGGWEYAGNQGIRTILKRPKK